MMEKEEILLKRRICELAENCYRRDVPVHTDFLTLNEQTIFHSMVRELPPVEYLLTGGYEPAERKIVCFLPSYEEPKTAVLPIRILKAEPAAIRFAEPLTHRDYLGALMNLGIERAVIGDILMRETGCFIFCLEGMAEYLARELNRVRHTPVVCELFSAEETGDAETAADFLSVSAFETVSGTVASPRLDSIVAMAFRTSRSKVMPLIVGEKVFIDGRLTTSPAVHLRGGEIVSVRGLGKFRYVGAGNESKKGRLFVSVERYK